MHEYTKAFAVCLKVQEIAFMMCTSV